MRGCKGHGACTRTHRPHQLLQGIQPSTGRFYTIVAEPYPRALCRRLVEAFALSIDRRYRLHPVHDIWAGKFREEGEEKKSRSGGAGNAVAPQLLGEKDIEVVVGGGNALPTNPPACAASLAPHLQFLRKGERLQPGYIAGFGKSSVYEWE